MRQINYLYFQILTIDIYIVRITAKDWCRRLFRHLHACKAWGYGPGESKNSGRWLRKNARFDRSSSTVKI